MPLRVRSRDCGSREGATVIADCDLDPRRDRIDVILRGGMSHLFLFQAQRRRHVPQLTRDVTRDSPMPKVTPPPELKGKVNRLRRAIHEA